MARRPKSIVYFEFAYLLAVAINLAVIYFSWDQWIAAAEATPGYAGRATVYVIWSLAFFIPANLTLWYFAARRRSVAAKWMIVGIALVNVFDFGTTVLMGTVAGDFVGLFQLAFYFLSFTAVGFLLRPDARIWFEGDNYPEIFR